MSFPSLRAPALRPWLRIIGLLSLVLALGGCSAVKLGYATLPEVAYWWLDGYADFEDTQRQAVREDIARVQAWHRANELPRYVELLQQMERLAPGDFTPAQACAFEPAIRERITALMRRLEPAVTEHALALQPRQLQHIQRKFEQRNREYQREWVSLSPADLIDKRFEEIRGRADTVYGTVNDAQLAVLREQLRVSPFNAATALEERRRKQQDAITVLRRLAGKQVAVEDARSAVRGLLDRFVTSPDPKYRAYVDALRDEACSMSSAMHAVATPAQREHAVRRLRGWQAALTELSADR